MSLDDHTTRRIDERVEDVLRRAGVENIAPTPMARIVEAAGIDEQVDVSQLPPDVQAKAPGAWAKILGALYVPSKTIFVDKSMAEGRQRWTTAHEVGHALLPWHGEIACDDRTRLSYRTREELEIEANYAAGHVLFQGRRFVERADDYQHSIASAVALSEVYGTSLHATIRFYAEYHRRPTALIMTGIRVTAAGRVPVYLACESAAFREQFGPVEHKVGNYLRVTDEGEETEIGQMFRAARLSSGHVTDSIRVADLDGERHRFKIEAFHNQYNAFFLLTPRRRIERGARVRLRAS